MTYADFEYYQNSYKGILITSADEYSYFAERAGDELAPFANRVPDTEEGQTALKRCACRIADILYGDWKQSKNGVSKNIQRERERVLFGILRYADLRADTPANQ